MFLLNDGLLDVDVEEAWAAVRNTARAWLSQCVSLVVVSSDLIALLTGGVAQW